MHASERGAAVHHPFFDLSFVTDRPVGAFWKIILLVPAVAGKPKFADGVVQGAHVCPQGHSSDGKRVFPAESGSSPLHPSRGDSQAGGRTSGLVQVPRSPDDLQKCVEF